MADLTREQEMYTFYMIRRELKNQRSEIAKELGFVFYERIYDLLVKNTKFDDVGVRGVLQYMYDEGFLIKSRDFRYKNILIITNQFRERSKKRYNLSVRKVAFKNRTKYESKFNNSTMYCQDYFRFA